jgi:hypothetical protein
MLAGAMFLVGQEKNLVGREKSKNAFFWMTSFGTNFHC